MNPSAHVPETPPTVRCPKCAADMHRYERAGVIVDQCRDCRGIFLDRGELERLIDLEAGDRPGESRERPSEYRERAAATLDRPRPSSDRPRDWDDDDDDRARWSSPQGKSKKRSLFGELFEGFGE